MVADLNWSEVGYSYPSCESIYVRKSIVGPGGGISLTPPLVLTEPNSTRITTQLGTIALEGFASPFSASTRQTMRSLTVGNDASVIRWLRSDNALRYSMGNDASGNGNQNWWLFDNVNGIYPLYFQSGAAGDTVGSIRWQGGRIAYDTATNQMTRRVANVVRETFDPTQYVLSSGGSVALTAATGLQLTSTLGMALQGGAGLILQSLDNGTLQAANTQNVTAGLAVNVTAGTDVVLNATGGDASLLANDAITIAGGGLVSMSTPADISITGTSSVTVAAGNGPVDVNGLGPVTIDGVNGTVLGGAAHPVGFYGSVGVAKQVGVPVTAAGIHAALVALNLIAP